MSILLNRDTKVIVQGITGKMARFHTKDMLDYGTNVVGGVVPGKGGETVEGVVAAIRDFETALAEGLDRAGLQAAMAPGAARWPPLIWAPSKAGPVGLEHRISCGAGW